MDMTQMDQTTDGQPPMSMATGGTNVVPPMSIAPPDLLQSLMQHPAVKNAVAQASQDIAKQHHAMALAAMQAQQNSPDISMGDDRTQKMINNMQAMRNSGVMNPNVGHPVRAGITNGLLAIGQGLTGQPYLSDYQQNQTQRMQQMADMAKNGMLTPEQQMMMGFRQESLENSKDAKNKTLWTGAIKALDDDRNSSRNPLGMAGRASFQVNRAKAVINNKNLPVTGQDLALVNADIASIMQGGNPTDMGMSHVQYKSAYQAVQEAKQWATSNPQQAMTPALKKKLNNTLQLIQDGNKRVISNSLKKFEAGNSKLISSNQDDWNNYKNEALKEVDDNSNQEDDNSPASSNVQSLKSKYGLS